MGNEYKIRVYTPQGTQLAEIVDFFSLGYSRRVNAPGMMQYTLDGNHYSIALLEDKSQVEIWRRDTSAGIDWYCDFYGIYRKAKLSYPDNYYFTATCPGQLSLLGWRINAFDAGLADFSEFTGVAAETVCKRLVQYNFTSDATVANGRDRAGNMTYPGTISIQADNGQGNSITRSFARKNVLTILQGLGGNVGGGDFDLVKMAAATWEFRWYLSQLGEDRTSTAIFSTDLDNMANPTYEYDAINEATVAIVGGQGTESARTVSVVTGDNYEVATNDIEMFIDGRQLDTAAMLTNEGDQELDAAKARTKFTYDILQTYASRYGRDYFLGDLVTARWGSISETQQIKGVTVSVKRDGSDTIDIDTETQ